MAAHWLSLDDQVDPTWWRPLELLAAEAAAVPGLPPVDPDDFIYVAWVEREGLPRLHVYRNLLSGRHLNIDAMGQLWRYVRRTRDGGEDYARLDGIADGLDQAELDRAERLATRTRRGPRAPRGIDGDGPSAVEVGTKGIGPEGIGPDGIGPDGIGPDGIGPDGIRPDGIGPDGIGPDRTAERVRSRWPRRQAVATLVAPYTE